MSDDKNQDVEQSKMNEGQDSQMPQSSDLGQLPSGFKITRGMIIIGLIIFVGVLFGIQRFIHFERSESDRSHAKDEMGNAAHGSNMVVANDQAHDNMQNPSAPNQVPVGPVQQNVPSTVPAIPAQAVPSPLAAPNQVPVGPVQQNVTSAVSATTAQVVQSVVPSPLAAPNPTGTASSSNQKNIQDIVRQYIVDHPEVVAEALQNLNNKTEQAKSTQSKDYIANNLNSMIANRPYFGNASGSSVIVEFFDYKCSYCRRSNLVIERVIKDYPEVKVVLEPVPVLGKNSADAVRAALAVWRIAPKNFRQFHDDLINSPTIDEINIMAMARKQGISTDALTKEMNSPEVQSLMNSNLDVAQQVGMRGVPTFIVNGELVPGSLSYEGFKDILDKARMRKK